MKMTMAPPGGLRPGYEHGENQAGDHEATVPSVGPDRRSLRRYAAVRIGFGVIWGMTLDSNGYRVSGITICP
jgi:hypothetical protein